MISGAMKGLSRHALEKILVPSVLDDDGAPIFLLGD